MGQREPLTEQERERIDQAKLEGKTLATIAAEIGCSLSCARKWWRRGRDEGRKGLQNRPQGPIRRGPLSRFAPQVAEAALALKRRHPRWGPDRILAGLRTDRVSRNSHCRAEAVWPSSSGSGVRSAWRNGSLVPPETRHPQRPPASTRSGNWTHSFSPAHGPGPGGAEPPHVEQLRLR